MDIVRLNLTEVRDKIAARELSATEVAKAVFKQIEATKQLNTLITLDEENALKAAAEIDARLDAGGDAGALGGVPIIVKDNISTRGLRTTCASRFLEN